VAAHHCQIFKLWLARLSYLPRKEAAMSYFRQVAAQTYRRARSSSTLHENYEPLMQLGRAFKAKATEAAARLARMRGSAHRRQEAKRQETYWDSRE
jgi:hypothetical protein